VRAAGADKRRAVALEMPEPAAPVSSESATGKKRQGSESAKKRQGSESAKRGGRRAADKSASPAAVLTPEELGAGVSRQQQEDLFKMADRKADAAEAWRTVGRAVLDAANRQFAALKADPWRSQLFAKSSVKVGPVKMDFAKELFDVSIDTMLPKMAERETKAAGKQSSSALTMSFTPKKRPQPQGLHVHEDRPGLSAFKEAKLQKADAVSSDASSETRSEAGSSAQTPTRKAPKKPTVDEAALEAEWDELAEDEKASFEAAEVARNAACEREISAWEQEQTAPKTAYGVRLREPQIARKLLRLPEHWKAFEYVSVAGHQVQQAKLTKVNMHYDVVKQELTLDCTVGYPEEGEAN